MRAYVFEHPLTSLLGWAKCLNFINGQHRAAITYACVPR